MLETLTGSPKLRVLKVEKNHYEAGITLFRRYHRLSFTDAVTVVVMQDIGASELYSFDSGFDGISGITRLTEI